MIRYLTSMLASLLLSQTIFIASASAEQLSITDRQQILGAKAEEALQTHQLTLEEFNDIQEDMAKLEDRIDKMAAENGGSLSYDDINSIEGDLNDISVQLHKKQLAKRVAD